MNFKKLKRIVESLENIDDMSNPITDQDKLKDLALNGNAEQKRAIASNPNTPLAILVHLATRGFAKEVLNNPFTSMDQIEHPIAIQDKDNPNPEIISQYISTKDAMDSDMGDPELQTILQHHKDPQIRAIVLASHVAPKHVLDHLLQTSDQNVIQKAVELHPAPYVLHKLLTHKDPVVRAAIAGNPDIPNHFRDILSNDENPKVAAIAKNKHMQAKKAFFDIMKPGI